MDATGRAAKQSRRPNTKEVTVKVLAALAGVVIALAAPALARADTVTHWNSIASTAIFVTAGQPPQQSVPHLAMVHGAVYDAVNASTAGMRGT
jgi:hypothetical protein